MTAVWMQLFILYPIKSHTINLVEFTAWIAELVKDDPSKEWVNFDIKEGEKGGFYAQLDTWKPEKQEENPKPKEESLPSWMKG